MSRKGIPFLYVISLLLIFLAVPSAGYAQEAVLTGTITDSTGGVLPGVTVTAIHEATGNRFVAVTDERGIYRIPARVGGYQLTAELQGFTTVSRDRRAAARRADRHDRPADGAVDGAGNRHRVSARRRCSTSRRSSLGGNINPAAGAGTAGAGTQLDGAGDARARQPHDVGHRDDAGAGSKHRRAARVPADARRPAGRRRNAASAASRATARKSIAEFQFISNRFDATMGRSSGVQVRAITRSGTNTFSGSVRGNFRDSRFNAENPVLNRVVPIDNQQIAFTLGGPDPARQAALLRTLRVRARAAGEHLEHAVSRASTSSSRATTR